PRPHASPTLFPYTTLFRSSAPHVLRHVAVDGPLHLVDETMQSGCAFDLDLLLPPGRHDDGDPHRAMPPVSAWSARNDDAISASRSEEHTSELQSRENLVCR